MKGAMKTSGLCFICPFPALVCPSISEYYYIIEIISAGVFVCAGISIR